MARKTTASAAVRREWGRRVEAEYRSAAITQHLTLWLIQLGVSPDLIHAGLRIVKDELAHAAGSHRAFVAAGGEAPPPIERDSLAIPRSPEEPLELAATRVAVESFCLGETVAVPLFKALRDGCTVPVARKVLDRVLVDEVRHRDFGWVLLQSMLDAPGGDRARRFVEVELPAMLARIRSSYAPLGASDHDAMPEADRAWGLMPAARYAAILERTVRRDYVPRFRKLGLDAAAAWTEAERLSPTPAREREPAAPALEAR